MRQISRLDFMQRKRVQHDHDDDDDEAQKKNAARHYWSSLKCLVSVEHVTQIIFAWANA